MTTRQKINQALDRLELLQIEIDRVIVALLQDIREMTGEQNDRREAWTAETDF